MFSILVHNCLNEVLDGLSRSSSVLRILERKAEIEELFEEWQASPRPELLSLHLSLIADVIEVVCSELGEDEFQTRVGVDLDQAKHS